jgi:DNA (cytosine-5)-methyltransferase 1
LFAGTGGMGLAALAASEFKSAGRIVWTAEQNPRYVGVISRNYTKYSKLVGAPEQVPETCTGIDLATPFALQVARRTREKWRQIDLMLAGPPCQGFSLANRLSRSSENPLNRLSLRIVDFVRIMEPRVLILENVPGIRTLRMCNPKGETATDILQKRLGSLGYGSSVLVLDASAYGVPQFRLRSFLVAARGFKVLPDDLVPPATHGPGRRLPYVTVRDALNDLPKTVNGNCVTTARYAREPSGAFQRVMRRFTNGELTDHITSRHSPYVLARYARVPPGGNWTSIRKLLSNNYEQPSRTHLNIYYRLDPKAPARTIGNFRKAMTIHPWEDRGLSLREAARLQSIPDWFSFSNPAEPMKRNVVPGLNAYQQQIGNAVSYLLTEKLVSHVARSIEL